MEVWFSINPLIPKKQELWVTKWLKTNSRVLGNVYKKGRNFCPGFNHFCGQRLLLKLKRVICLLEMSLRSWNIVIFWSKICKVVHMFSKWLLLARQTKIASQGSLSLSLSPPLSVYIDSVILFDFQCSQYLKLCYEKLWVNCLWSIGKRVTLNQSSSLHQWI